MARAHIAVAAQGGGAGVAVDAAPAEPAADRAPRTDLGRRLRARRLRTGRSIAEVASAAQVDPGYLTFLEDRPTLPQLETLARLARALETTVPDLLGWAEPRSGGRHGRRSRPDATAPAGGDQRP